MRGIAHGEYVRRHDDAGEGLIVLSDAVVRRVWEELEPAIVEHAYELIEVEFGSYGGGHVLRLFIDKEGGITIDDCQAVSRLVSPLLDEKDFISENYMLEVSSPGIDRPIRKPKDFGRFKGEAVKVKTHTPVNGRKRINGLLVGFADDMVMVDCGGEVFRVHLENLKKANLDR